MLRRRHINAGPGGRFARAAVALADLVRWPLERLAWSLERRILWPLRERVSGRGMAGRGGGLIPSRRLAGAGALVVVALAAVLAGLLLSKGNGGAQTERVAMPARIAAAAAPVARPTAKESSGPVLHGVTPSFGVGRGVDVGGEASGGETAASQAEAADGEGESAEEALESFAGEGGASTSSAKPVPAGPAAMKVARRFAKAFVFYEIGKRPERAKAVFADTATPQLAGALADRPPRLPQDAEVPKAKVVNLVPGPRHGKAYTVSASLLRVGLTSELRLEMRQQKGEWLVTDVRG